ncbi:hypothetical protein VVD49_05890 [Uliginosibacterium sp. H3]|uniref:Uncharacterized protein n=1 Tax=Uliginosibacterium silvisoli TaxID=3114758 RepID=A0ABU6K2I1_9RHOO|nr:hypothetical protein [Uliginosibacterium sp. H3]
MAIQNTSPAAQGADDDFSEQFQPAPLSWLLTWLFRPRHAQAVNEQDGFDEHINGLA